MACVYYLGCIPSRHLRPTSSTSALYSLLKPHGAVIITTDHHHISIFLPSTLLSTTMDDPYQPRIWRLEDHFLPVEQLPPLLYHVRHAHSLTSFGPNGDIYTSHPIKSLFIASRDKLDDLVR